MISQPAVQSTGMASGPVPDQPTENGGLFAGFLTVAPWRVPILFLRSLDPGYIPPGTQPSAQPDKGPAFTFGSPGGKDSSFFQGVELAARLVSPYTVLPAEIRTMLEGIVTFSAATRFRDLLGAFGATKDSPPTASRADISEDGSPTNDKGRKNKKPQQTPQRASPPATTAIGTGQLQKTAVALGALSSLTAAAAAFPSGNKTEVPILVPNATTLGKIGRDPAYPLNGTYRQTANIDGSGLSHSIGNKTHAFTGEYNGLYRAITGLDCCLVDNLEGEIGNLHFTGANIISTSRPAGVVACEMGGNGTIRHISVHKSKVITTGNDADAGIGVGVLLGGTLDNIFALHSKVTTTGEGADAGIGSGSIGNGSAISRIGAFNSQVTTTGNNSNAAIGAGYVNGTVVGTSAYQNKVTTSGAGANAGIGAGAMGDGTRLADTFAKDCKVFTSGAGANAGIGAGRIGRSARVANTSAQCFSSVITTGDEANAGIGAGFMDPWARIVGTRSRNSKVVTSGVRAHAGIGAGMIRGNASVIDTLAVNSRATASGNNASADIGAGRIEPGGVVTNTTQVNTGVLTCEPAKPAYTPASVVTASNTAMSVSDFPGATMTLPTSAAPLANTLSNGAIAGITLGAAVAFALAGVVGGFIYRHCYCRPYPADDGAPQNENRQSA